MSITAERLNAVIEKIKTIRIAVLGDLMLDRYVSGTASRLSQEAPVPVLHVRKSEVRLGGAANVMRNLTSLGVKHVLAFGIVGNQIIGQLVEEDVGFGPENMGIETGEIWERVEESLRAVGMYEFRKHSPNHLSGGQKQRVSIAGVLAMHPKCIILDEPTAMLDPQGRKEVLRAVRALNDVEQVTVILITHYMEEAVYSDRVFVMDHGRIVLQGTPKEVFSEVEELQKYRLEVPQPTLLAHLLRKEGMKLPSGILTKEELADEIIKLYHKKC